MNATLHKLIHIIDRYGRAQACSQSVDWLKGFPESATLRDVLIALPYRDREWLSIALESLTKSTRDGELIWLNWCVKGGSFAENNYRILRNNHYSETVAYLHQRDYRWLEWKLLLWETEGRIIEQLLRDAKV